MAKTVADDIMLASASEANCPGFSQLVPEAASQSFLKGWLYQVFNGLAVGITSDTPGNIYGLGEQDGHNASTAGTYGDVNKSINITLANDITVFSANVKGASLADHVLVLADLNRQMGIQRDTTNNKIFLDSSVVGGANARVFTFRPAQNTDIGDTNGRVLFVFNPNYLQSQSTS